MRHLFVMDPLDRLNLAGDSTYVTMVECSRRDHQVWWCTPDRLFGKDGHGFAHANPVVSRMEAPHFRQGSVEVVAFDDVDVIWMRKDPPFDMGYVFTTYLLDLAPRTTLVVNAPAGLKLFNEKMWAMRFPSVHPSTLVSNNVAELRAHIQALPGRAVIKPWDGNGGRGVLVTQAGDRNLGSMLELLTSEGREYILCQPFLDGVERGDKRVVLFDGEPVGAMLRVPGKADFRGNMHVGATVEPCEIDASDRRICDLLGPELKRWGQVFVGIDVIDGHLTEINVTSPTGLQEMNRLYGVTLQSDLVDCVEARRARQLEAQ